jgi:hypothetical protein
VLRCCRGAVLLFIKHSAEGIEFIDFVEFTLCYGLRVEGYRLQVVGCRL